VATEIVGIVGLTVLLLIVAAVRSLGHWSNLTSTGPVPSVGYYAWLGPFMLATLLGAYTIVGFESASNLAEETHEPHRVIPKAMLRAVLVSGVVGFAFLIALAYATNKAAYASTAPVASIVHDVLGGVVQKIFLVFVCVSIFACGLIIMVTNSRLIFSMSRDRRLPGHQLLHQVPRATGGPPWATILAAVLSGAIALALRTHTPPRSPRCSPRPRSCRPCCTRAPSCCTCSPRGSTAPEPIAAGPARSGDLNFRSWPER
jgi:amino acid transporter